jgi:DNA-binding transcriptional ArsR family regulator
MAAVNGYTLQAQLLRALAHPVRLQILNILSRQEACVCHLTAALRRPQPYMSQQLAILRDAGLVDDRREGTLIYYHVADERINALLRAGRELVENLAEGPASFPAAPAEKLESCPCPHCSAE